MLLVTSLRHFTGHWVLCQVFSETLNNFKKVIATFVAGLSHLPYLLEAFYLLALEFWW